jgi:hypothetical protein
MRDVTRLRAYVKVDDVESGLVRLLRVVAIAMLGIVGSTKVIRSATRSVNYWANERSRWFHRSWRWVV